jgi:hypothetical protein
MPYETDDTWDQLGRFLAGSEPRPTARCGNVRCELGWHWRVDLTDYGSQ